MTYDPTKVRSTSGPGAMSAPASQCVVVSPSNTVDLDPYAKSILIGATGGTLKFIPLHAADDTGVTIDVAANQLIPIQARRIFATGTTATPVYALYS